MNFAPGLTTQTVRFELNQQTAAENIESLYIALTSPTNATIANNAVLGTIIDNDTLVGDTNSNSVIDASEKANLSVRDVVIDEKAGTATFDLTLDKATTDAFTVAYSTATTAGTATAGSDFTAAVGSVGFAAGQTVQHVTVSITDDATAEGNEFFNLTLGALSGGAASQVTLVDKVGAALIGANDQTVVATPSLTVRDAVAIENTGYVDFLVQLSAPATGTVSVQYTLGNYADTASEGSDWSGADGTLVFNAGETTRTIRLAINQDLVLDSSIEQLSLTLSNPSGATIATATAICRLADEDNLTTSNPMAYGLSNDIYTVTKSADLVLETQYGGTDLVNSSISYTLTDWVEKLTLTGAAVINGTGNTLANTITGNTAANALNGSSGNDTLDGGSGNDSLSGGTGVDSMIGGAGNDSYVVDNTADIVTEGASAGTDLVQSSSTYTLSANVENLTLTGTAALNGTGNTLANTIIGNSGTNIIIGGAGNDILNGGAGTDTLSYSSATGTVTVSLALTSAQNTGTAAGTDTVSNFENLTGSTYNDTLTGSTGNNVINGGIGNDLISGGAGRDTLVGGAGSDTFVFNTALSATTNLDTISDYSSAADTIKLENGIFTRLTTTGTLNSLYFKASLTGAATDADDRILYDTDSGALYYDADGSGSGAKVQFATLTGHPAINYADFVVI